MYKLALDSNAQVTIFIKEDINILIKSNKEIKLIIFIKVFRAKVLEDNFLYFYKKLEYLLLIESKIVNFLPLVLYKLY